MKEHTLRHGYTPGLFGSVVGLLLPAGREDSWSPEVEELTNGESALGEEDRSTLSSKIPMEDLAGFLGGTLAAGRSTFM